MKDVFICAITEIGKNQSLSIAYETSLHSKVMKPPGFVGSMKGSGSFC